MIGLWRIDLEPGNPEHNMTVDAELLTALAEGREYRPTIRVYQWDRPAISIGRLQSEEAVRAYYPGLPLVRRPTGGRAVRHGDDLTISIAILIDQLPDASGKTILTSYRCLVEPLVATLARIGHEIGYGSEIARGQRAVVDCFEVSAGCDLIDVSTGRKLVGSAQRRQGAALLQQMSLPLSFLPSKDQFVSHLQCEYAYSLQIHSWQRGDW